jgi:DNA-binding XRE family transcriptional regulator
LHTGIPKKIKIMLDNRLKLSDNTTMRLKTYLEMKGMPQGFFARVVEVSPAMISYLLSGKKDPGLKLAMRIKKATKGKVCPEDFLK